MRTTLITSKYKQTEIGIIPEDWCVEKMNTVADVRDGTHDSPKYVKRGVKFVTSKNIVNNKLDLSEISYISDSDAYEVNKRSKVDKGDILMSMIGTIGSATLINFEPDFCIKNVALIKPYPKRIKSDFLIQLILSPSYQRYINYKLEGGIQKFISLGVLRDLDVILPADEYEQTAIFTSLSDIDHLIEKLNKLIEKKKSVKLGAMQELLTGKQRLPGFSGQWMQKPLTEVSWFQEGPGVRTSQFTERGIKLLNGTNIYRGKMLLENTNRFISESEAFGPYSHFLVDVGDIVIASSGITIDKFEEKIAFIKKEHLPLCMNTSTIRFKVKDSLVPRFLYYFLMSKKFKGQIGAQATGSAQLNFGPSHLDKVEISLPKDKSEQDAIAGVLSDMDAEIEKLESQLSKYQNIKQGMMQTLLTGKIRLISK